MLSSLLLGLPEDSKKDVIIQAKECALLMKQLRKHFEQKLEACEKKRRSRKNYFMPAWKEYQADCNGYLRGIEETIETLQSISDQR